MAGKPAQGVSNGGDCFAQKAPPPPMMPKNPAVRKVVEPVANPRDELLSAIRNFGGKKGLRSAKV